MRAMPNSARVLVLVSVWVPLLVVFVVFAYGTMPGGGIAMLAATFASVAVGAAVSVAVVSGWLQEARADDPNAPVPLPEPVGEGATFEFKTISWRGAAVAGVVVLLYFAGTSMRRRGSIDGIFLAAIGVLAVAVLVLMVRKGRDYIRIYDDRLRAGTAFWRTPDDEAEATEIPFGDITRVAVERGRGLNIEISTGVSAWGASIPLNSANLAEGVRCLSKVLEVVSPEVVGDEVLRLRDALELLNAAGDRAGDSWWAEKALHLVGRDRLEEAAQLLATAESSDDLRRAGAEFAEVARATAK